MKKDVQNSPAKKRIVLVIPTLGERLELLEETLDSAVTKQSNLLDVIVVCPKTATGARDLAKKYDVEIADDPRTLSGAINVGIALAKPWHEYACWMGDDDLLRPGSINKAVTILDTNHDAAIAYGYCDYVDDDGNILFTNKVGNLAPWIMSWGPNLVPLIGMVYRIKSLHKAGDFDTSLKYSMDLDMLLRLRKIGRFINTKQTLGAFRWHSSSTTVANRSASLNEARRVKKKYLSKSARYIEPLWEMPVQLATHVAARITSKRAKKSLIKHHNKKF